MRFLIFLLFPSIALAQIYATGDIQSLSTESDGTKNIYSTKQVGSGIDQKDGVYSTSGFKKTDISQAQGPVLYTRGANGDVYEVQESDCIAYAYHEPRGDVSHEAAGDVSANPKNPAFDSLIDEQRIFLDIPISNYIDGANFNLPLSDQARVNVGDVVVKDGKTFFNGQEIIPQAIVDCE